MIVEYPTADIDIRKLMDRAPSQYASLENAEANSFRSERGTSGIEMQGSRTMNKFRGKLVNITGTQLMFRGDNWSDSPLRLCFQAIGEAIDFGISHLGDAHGFEVKNGIIMSLTVWDSSQGGC